MLLCSLLVGLLATAPVVASMSIEDPKICANQEPSAEYIAAMRDVIENEKSGNFTPFAEDIMVDMYIHVVAPSEKPDDGYISVRSPIISINIIQYILLTYFQRETVEAQAKVINDNFKGSGFQFVLKDATWTVNSNWAKGGDEMSMKKKLRKGNYAAVNIYLVHSYRGYLGYCWYPTSASPGSDAETRDGCQVVWTTVPGGPRKGNNEGKIASHEVGHWAGLFHTFDGGCGSPGDHVDDTPPQSKANTGCPTGKDSCQGGGPDPIHNHMDYTNE